MSETRKLAAILVADVVGYSRLAGADEDRTLARLRALRSDLIDPTIAVHHGRIVKRALVNAMHITASVFINDDERGLHADYDDWLERLAPHEPVSGYRHNRTGEDNADAHMKRQIMGREVVIAITAGKLDFSSGSASAWFSWSCC